MKSVDQEWNKTVDLCFISGLLATGLGCVVLNVFQFSGGEGGGVPFRFHVRSIISAQPVRKGKENQRDVDDLTQELRVWEQPAVLILSNIYE